MAVKNRKRLVIIAIIILGLCVVAVSVGAIANRASKQDPYVSKNPPAKTTNDPSNTNSQDDTAQSNTQQNGDKNTTTPAIDPSQVSTLAISQLGITVSYVKGINGFSYSIERAPSGSQYVEFFTDSLKGTKCSDDDGQFASILVNPDGNEKATVSKTVTIDSVVYGLSLSAATCTGDASLLAQYQKSFSDAFGLLKKTN